MRRSGTYTLLDRAASIPLQESSTVGHISVVAAVVYYTVRAVIWLQREEEEQERYGGVAPCLDQGVLMPGRRLLCS